MRITTPFCAALALMACSCALNSQKTDDYKYVLQQSLSAIEQLGDISYQESSKSWMPWETEDESKPTPPEITQVIDAPEDEFAGCYFATYDTQKNLRFAYDGKRRMRPQRNSSGVYEVDSLFIAPHNATGKVRVFTVPFFHSCKRMISYALAPSDTDTTKFQMTSDDNYFKIVMDLKTNDKETSLCFDLASRDPHVWNPTEYEVYTLFIDKNNFLPRKFSVERSYANYSSEVSNLSKGTQLKKPFTVWSVLPPDGVLADETTKAPEATSQPKDLTGQKAPDWKLKDTEGAEHNLSDYKGNFLLVEFTMHKGCGFCYKAEPFVEKLNDVEKLKVVSIDETGDTESCHRYQTKQGLKRTCLIDSPKPEENVMMLYASNRAVPQFFLIDPEGTVRYARCGFSDGDEMAKEILAIVNAKK